MIMHPQTDFYSKLKNKAVTAILENLREELDASLMGQQLWQAELDGENFEPAAIQTIDNFLLFGKTQGGWPVLHVLRAFGKFSGKEIEVLNEWSDQAFPSVFEVRDVRPDSLELLDLIAEVPYTAYSSIIDDQGKQFASLRGQFIRTNLAPVKGDWFLSGSQRVLLQDEQFIFDSVISQADTDQSLRNNPEKLRKSLELQKEYYDDFVKIFGGNEVIVYSFEELKRCSNKFWKKWNKYGMNTLPDRMNLKSGIRETGSLGWLVHETEGFHFIFGYDRFVKIFQNPNQVKKDDIELVSDFLTEDSIPWFAFARMKDRYPQGFQEIMRRMVETNQTGFNPMTDFDQLMDIYKPGWQKPRPSFAVVNQRFEKYFRQRNQDQSISSIAKIGRNDPCPCGATKPDGAPLKFKKCCGK